MGALLNTYGKGLVALFVGSVVAWACLLIAFPQFTMLEMSVTAPGRALDSSVAATVVRDARTCQAVLKNYLPAEEEPVSDNGGLAIPSASGMAVPSASGMAVPSASGMAVPSASGMAVPSASGMAVPSASGMAVPSASGMAVPSAGGMAVPSASAAPKGATRPYILQCDRATTETTFVRSPDEPRETLVSLHDLPQLSVDDTLPVEEQIEQAKAVAAAVDPLHKQLLEAEANALPYTAGNFEILIAARAIPMTPETKAVEDAKLSNQLFGLMGLRFEEGGVTHVRLSLVTLVRTLFFAVLATTLALVVCYPIAYNLALNASPQKAVWLFLALIIPYAIVELMRVYAWVSLIETEGMINHLLDWIGLIDLANDEAIPFKRSPITVFVVIVYTYILFMVFPMVNVMSTLDKNQLEAGRDLGASTWRLHWRIIIPHAKPGIAVGCITTFMLSAGAFSVPRIISRGLQSEWFSQTIYNKFFESENSNVGAAYSFAFTILCFTLVALFMWLMRARLKDFVRA